MAVSDRSPVAAYSGEGYSKGRTARKASGNHLGYFPRHDIESEVKDTDNGVNDAICSRQVGSHSAGNGVRHFRSSASENLTMLQIGMKNKALKVACWNVRTMFEAGKVENVKSEMSR